MNHLKVIDRGGSTINVRVGEWVNYQLRVEINDFAEAVKWKNQVPDIISMLNARFGTGIVGVQCTDVYNQLRTESYDGAQWGVLDAKTLRILYWHDDDPSELIDFIENDLLVQLKLCT